MYFPESESLASELPSLKNQVERIDEFLSKNRGKFVNPARIAYHTKLEQEDVELVLSHLLKTPVIVASTNLQCSQCENTFTPSKAGHAYCDICDCDLSEATCTKLAGYRVQNFKKVASPDCAVRLASCPPTVINDLRDRIQNGHAVVLVGAGASMAATQNASLAGWTGFLEEGLKWCEDLSNKPSKAWFDSVNTEIASKEVDLMISAAEKIQTQLDKIREFRRFLKETVGALTVKDPDLLDAIIGLDVPVMTTNYDNLLEEASGLAPIRWNEQSAVEEWVHGDRKGILHVHGYFTDPTSVILGSKSYNNVATDIHFQAMLKALRTFKTILYVGFGGSLTDPNFSQFFSWGEKIFSDSNYRQYKFCREGATGLSQKEIDNRIVAVNFGQKHSELGLFLNCLKHGPTLVGSKP